MATPNTKPAIDLSSLTPEQIAQAIAMQSTDAKKAIAKATGASLKSEKAEAKGEITKVVEGEDGLLYVAISIGHDAGKTGKGEAYLFQADGIRFEHSGKKWRLGAVYAIEVK